MHARISAFVAALVLLGTGLALGQTETGRITGVVLDQSGAVVPGATVTLTSTGTGAVRTSATDAGGRYVFANVPAGPYTLTVELSGFTTERRNLTLTVGGVVDVESQLRIASAAETVNVVADMPLVNTTNAEVSTTIRQQQIRELPTVTRNVYDLVAIAGSAVEAPEAAIDVDPRGAGFNLNGQRASGTNILLDGAANNNEFDTTVGQQVPLDSIQEFAVITNNFSAQFGRASGGIVNAITKSGTNNFSGSAYEYFRSDELATNTVDNKANDLPKPDFARHQPGFSIGGPIARDKAFFFGSFEYIRVRSFDREISWVPTPEFLATMAPAARAFFEQYGRGVQIDGPTLTRGDVSDVVGSGAGAFNALPANLPVFGRVEKQLPINAGAGDPQDHYQFVGRVDWNITNELNSYVRYAYQNQDAFPGTNGSSPYPGFDTGYLEKNHNLLGSITGIWGPSFTTQSKVVFNRLYEEQPLAGPPVPTLYMNPTGPVRLQGYRIAFPGYFPWSPGNAIPFGGPQHFLQLYQDQTWLRGAHDVRFGGSFVHIRDDRTFGAYMNSVEALNTTSNALISLNNLVQGQIARFQTAINPGGFPGGTYVTPVELPSFTSFNRYNEYALYAQDNWRLTNRVTVNLGLRYEYYGPQKKSRPKFDSNFYYADPNASANHTAPLELIRAIRDGQVLTSNQSPVGALWTPDKNNFAPRLGFAWDVTGDGTTSVRGGYGISYERNFGNVTYNVLFNPPDYLVATIEAPLDVPTVSIATDLAGPFGGVAGVTKVIPAGSLRHVDQNIETAYVHQWGASLQRQLTPGIGASVEYNATAGRKLYDLADTNKRGAPLVYEGIGTGNTRPNPAYAAFNTRGNRGRSLYHGVTFAADVRDLGDSGLALTARYTMGNAKDNLSSTFSEGGNGFFNLGYLDPYNCDSDNKDCGPMLDWGYAEFDVRQRFNMSAIWNLPFLQDDTSLAGSLLGGWSLNWLFTARSGFPFSIYDCSNSRAVCMRALAPDSFDRSVSGGSSTGNPNEYNLLDLTSIVPLAGTYVHPRTGDNDWGPYPSNMTHRNDFRGPGAWFTDFALAKRFRIGGDNAGVFRLEVYNLFEHANMYVLPETADVSSSTFIAGRKSQPGNVTDSGSPDANRRIQLGFRYEF